MKDEELNNLVATASIELEKIKMKMAVIAEYGTSEEESKAEKILSDLMVMDMMLASMYRE